jgi:hypothetical protein
MMRVMGWVVCAVLLLLSASLVMAQDETQLPFTVSESEEYVNRFPQLVTDGAGNLHVVWNFADPTVHGNGELLHRSRSSEGEWSPVTNLSSIFTYWSQYQLVRTTSGNVCVYMAGAITEVTMVVQERCLVDGTWQDPTPLDAFAPAIGNYDMVYDANNALQGIYIASNRVIFATTGEDLGYSPYAIPDQFVIDAAGGYHVAWVTMSDSGAFVIEYRYSDDAGASWSSIETLSQQGAVRQETQPKFAADSLGNVHLLYVTSAISDELVSTVEYRQWTADAGWGDAVVVAEASAFDPDLAVDANGLAYAVWHVIDQVSFAHQRPDGTWTEADDTLLEGIVAGGATILLDDSNTIHLVFADRLAYQLQYTQLSASE